MIIQYFLADGAGSEHGRDSASLASVGAGGARGCRREPGREKTLRRPPVKLQQTRASSRQYFRRSQSLYQTQALPAHRCGKFFLIPMSGSITRYYNLPNKAPICGQYFKWIFYLADYGSVYY